MSMRIANVIEEGKLGGPQVQMVRVSAALKGRVERLIVMPRANSDPFRAMCDSHGVAHQTLPLTRMTREWRAAMAYVLFSPWEVLRLARLFRRERIDLVHAAGGSFHFKAVIAGRLAGVPSVWHINDTSMPGWVRRLFRRVAPLASGFIFDSHRSQSYYADLIAPGRLQTVIPSTVDTSWFDPDQHWPGDEALLQRLGTAPVIGTIANINPVKGLEVLVRAFARLHATRPDARLVIVGPVHANQAGHHQMLSALAKSLGVAEAIIWAGTRTDVRPLLARFDVYACSSHAESSPVSVWEAMAMARPVVSTDVGDVARHVKDDETGFVVSPGDFEGMADRILCLLDDTERRARIGAAARCAAAEFSPGQIAEATLGLYHAVLKRSGVRAPQRE